MIKDENYYTVKGWMINRLHLKGTQLMLYAIIYGFSQDGKSEFKGSVQYLADFVGVTEASARANLKALAKQGLITITSESGYCNRYSAVLKKTAQDDVFANRGIEYCPEQKKPQKPQISADIEQVVDYLNNKAGKKFKSTTVETVKPIRARLNEGFTVEDFKNVIDIKVAEWADDEKMNKYLRPQTLFGTKFQSYLNQKAQAKKATASYDLDSYAESMKKPLKYERRKK